MVELHITPDEVRERRILPVHLDAAMRAIDEDGFVVLRNVVDPAHPKAVYDQMLRDIALVKAKHPHDFEDRRNVWASRDPAFLFHDILMNPIAAQVMSAAMTGRVTCGLYQSNVTYPHSGEQVLHVDMAPRKAGDKTDGPCRCVVMNHPLVDFTVENGATEVWPGTHLVPCEIDSRYPSEQLQAKRRAERPPERAIMPRGSVLIRDIRLWHRGTQNHTDIVRPMIAMICTGEFNPVFEPLERRISVGKFPRSARSFFESDATIGYNVQYVDAVDLLELMR